MADNSDSVMTHDEEIDFPIEILSTLEPPYGGPPWSPRTLMAIAEASFPILVADFSTYPLCSCEDVKELVISFYEQDERIFHCPSDSYSPHFFFVYWYMFRELGMKLPFSDFACGVLTKAFTAPSQLQPNVWAFIRCFEILADYFRF